LFSFLLLCLCVPYPRTATAAAICVELYKILLDKPVEQLRNTFSNLALPLFTSAEPDPPKATTCVVKGKEWKWTAVRTANYFFLLLSMIFFCVFNCHHPF
jgi:hypothetical protein